MEMNCGKCGGRVFVDRMFVGNKKKRKGDGEATNEESTNVELSCIMCGKRWMLNREKNVFAAWLAQRERLLSAGYATSS